MEPSEIEIKKKERNNKFCFESTTLVSFEENERKDERKFLFSSFSPYSMIEKMILESKGKCVQKLIPIYFATRY